MRVAPVAIGAIGTIDTVRPRCRSHTVRLGVLSSRSMRKKMRRLMPHVKCVPIAMHQMAERV